MAVNRKKNNHIIPGTKPLENEALVKLIKKAEQGPFYTSAEIKASLKKWKSKRA